MRPARHHLVWLSEAGREAIILRRPDLCAAPAIRTWIDAGFPVMSRRTAPGDDPLMWPAAIALPPAQGRLRVPLEVKPGEVLRVTPPPLLRAALDGRIALADGWRHRIASVLRLADDLAIQPRMFGSLMWQTVTGLAFLRPGSDLDLLWQIEAFGNHAAADLPVLLDGLRMLDRVGPPRLDGELLFGRSGVHWREWAAAAPEDTVLLKTDTGARLVPRSAWPTGWTSA